MTIDPYAFNNCISLIELDFCLINDISMTGIMQNDNTPSTLKIIVRDNNYITLIDNELICNKHKLIKYSSILQNEIDLLKNSKLLQALYHLFYITATHNTDTILYKLVSNIIKFIFSEYNIIYNDYLQYETLQHKKEFIENEH